MGEYEKALSVLLARCPRCGAQNIPNAKPTLEPEQDGSRTCATCSHNWKEDR